jgi:hypothetical protein
MKALLLAAVAAVSLAAPAAAQSTTTTTTTTQRTTVIEPAQRTAIREYVVRERRPAVAAPSGFSVSVGATLPGSVELHAFPETVGVRQYRYTVIGDRTVLVEPGSRRIVEVLE